MMSRNASAVKYAALEAPSVLGLFPGGVEGLPDALFDAGFVDALDARRARRVEPPPYDPGRDPATGLLNPQSLHDYALALADELGLVLDAGETPIVLGGDCSIVLGNMLALQRRGRYGLLFLDGHADFYQPEAELAGEAASMDLALVTGRGPAIVTRLEGPSPLVRDNDVVLFARRDGQQADADGSQRVEDTDIHMIDLDAVREVGVHAAAAAAVEHLCRHELDGFWVHLDCDVLDDDLMPAVDYRLPGGGLSWDELATTLQLAFGSGCAVGIEITIFNPSLDPERTIARALAACLVSGLEHGAADDSPAKP